MKQFKQTWQIQHNWQLIFPLLGSIMLLLSSYKLANLFTKTFHIAITVLVTVIVFYALLKLILFLFEKLKTKWNVTYRWELISIFMVFAITGSSSVFIGRPIIKLLGITKENLNAGLYWLLYIGLGFIFYQILLVLIGWLFGQYKFFWEFEKKMLSRLGLGRFL